MRRIYLATTCLALALVASGCGGSDGDVPESVSAADLAQGADFWLSLDDELRRELGDICHAEEIKRTTSPAELQLVQDFDVDDYVAYITDYYEEDDGSGDIEQACGNATVELASENFDQIAPQLDQ